MDEGITVSGDEEALRRVLEILLDNAIKYSAPAARPGNSPIGGGRNHCALTAGQPGGTDPAESAARSLQRFYRADPARSRNGSFGLATIAEGIVASTTEPLT
ncbi:MAG: hypothetical protein ACLRWQ_01950 [Flavonifractor plautii]